MRQRLVATTLALGLLVLSLVRSGAAGRRQSPTPEATQPAPSYQPAPAADPVAAVNAFLDAFVEKRGIRCPGSCARGRDTIALNYDPSQQDDLPEGRHAGARRRGAGQHLGPRGHARHQHRRPSDREARWDARLGRERRRLAHLRGRASGSGDRPRSRPRTCSTAPSRCSRTPSPRRIRRSGSAGRGGGRRLAAVRRHRDDPPADPSAVACRLKIRLRRSQPCQARVGRPRLRAGHTASPAARPVAPARPLRAGTPPAPRSGTPSADTAPRGAVAPSSR